MQTTEVLAVAAVAMIGPLAGMSLDQSVKQLPARHSIGVSAFSAYQRAADLANGAFLYPIFGVGAALLAILAAISGHVSGLASPVTIPLDISAALAVLHSITTGFAATTAFSQRKYALSDEAALARVFNQFERWQTLRVVLQVLNFGAALWAVVVVLSH